MIMTVIILQGKKLRFAESQTDFERQVVSIKPIFAEENKFMPEKIAVVILSKKQEISKSDYVFYECVSEEIAYKGARFATFYSGKESYVIKVKKGYIVVCDKSVCEYVNYAGKYYYKEISHPCVVAKIVST